MIEVFIPIGHRIHGSWSYAVASMLARAGAPVTTVFRGFDELFYAPQYEVIVERGLVEHFSEPGGDRFVWREA